jgi:predicted amidohydrolase
MSGSTTAFSPRGEQLAALGPLDAGILSVEIDPAEVDLARATIPLLGDLSAVLPDLWLDDEIPVARRLEEYS